MFAVDAYTVKVAPLMVLGFCAFGLTYNTISWVIEIKRSAPLKKARLLWDILTCNPDV